MKTAIEEAIDFIENKDYNYLDGKFLQFANEIKDKLTELLQKEREHIESAYKKGKVNGIYKFDKEPNITDSEYYEITFKK